MILKKLYTIPNKFFEPVVFKPGFNFVFGKKEYKDDQKESLNGIGKSTFLELIDFALLSSFTKRDQKRIYKAWLKGILKDVKVVLEFSVDEQIYKIIRSFDNNTKILFVKPDDIEIEYYIDDLKPVLCDLVFKRSNYDGYYSNEWWRRLIPFFVKIHSTRDHKFVDPILYLKRGKEAELLQFHLFLLNIDNTLAARNYDIQKKLKSIRPAIKSINDFLLTEYKLDSPDDAENRISNLMIEAESLQQSIDLFHLSKQYKVEESKADELTSSIKELWFQNNLDKQKIEQYLNSFNQNTSINTNKIKNLYSEFNAILGANIKKSLDEVIAFRKDLSKSRQNFLSSEIELLKGKIIEREKQIDEMENERAEVYKFLSAQKAITDLQEAYYSLNKLRDKINELESQIRTHRELSRKKIKLEQEEKEIEASYVDFKENITQKQRAIARVISSIYSTLYADVKAPSEFVIESKFETNAKLHLNVLESNKMLSTGRNQGRTLIYDLAIILHAIDNDIKLPRFIIHDAIFDGMDKSHLIELYKFVNSKVASGKNFQYILTLNEEGHLTDNFGDGELLEPDKIADEAIIVLSPNKLLFGDF